MVEDDRVGVDAEHGPNEDGGRRRTGEGMNSVPKIEPSMSCCPNSPSSSDFERLFGEIGVDHIEATD